LLLSIPLGDVGETVTNVQDTVYNNFAMRFGTMTDSTNYLFQRKYDNLSVRVLKKRLHSLKRNATPNSSTEIRYVSSLIRKKLINNVTNNNNGPVVWYQKDIRSKF